MVKRLIQVLALGVIIAAVNADAKHIVADPCPLDCEEFMPCYEVYVWEQCDGPCEPSNPPYFCEGCEYWFGEGCFELDPEVDCGQEPCTDPPEECPPPVHRYYDAWCVGV